MIPVSLGLNAANKSSMKIDGAVFVRLAVTVGGQTRTCATMVYATQYKAQTAVSIPINWQKPIKQLYANDLELGVIEPAPADEDNKWCHREVYVGKSSGAPHRCIDYKPGLNRWVKRDTYATESPFHVVRRIPGNTWKTVTDVWNGYNLVPLHLNSKKLTIFISMEGKFRYTNIC